jgi:UrcA family protein
MPSKTGTTITRGFMAAALLVFSAGGAAASDHNVTVSSHISSDGLDLSQPADARTFYSRLENAAYMLCTRGTRADLVPVDNVKVCYEKALGDAVRAAKRPMVTLAYLGNHTLQQAAAYSIEVPARVAAK